MSNSNVRLYEVFESNDTAKKISIKGLAVKAREIVVSNVSKSQAWLDAEAGLSQSDVRRKMPFHPEQELTEKAILEHFAPLLGDTLIVRDIVEGVDLSALVASLTVTPATPSTGVDTTVQFAAAVLPAEAQQDVIWSIQSQANLSIDQNGLVTVGSVTLGDYTVTATSTYNGAVLGTATLTVA